MLPVAGLIHEDYLSILIVIWLHQAVLWSAEKTLEDGEICSTLTDEPLLYVDEQTTSELVKTGFIVVFCLKIILEIGMQPFLSDAKFNPKASHVMLAMLAQGNSRHNKFLYKETDCSGWH